MRLDLLTPTDTSTRCPYKGVATEYWSRPPLTPLWELQALAAWTRTARARTTKGREKTVTAMETAATKVMAVPEVKCWAMPPAIAAPIPCHAIRPADSTPWTWPRTGSGVNSRSCSWSGRVAAKPAPAMNTAAVATSTGGWAANSR
ncbi:hypothetical protein AB0K47_23650 [Streptomyces tirandamycinicus]|uniref:hypothetical protein n=1 Tax=Streptomyces tirandamycinicus TaxID=2174846 RepID=UPI00344746C7